MKKIFFVFALVLVANGLFAMQKPELPLKQPAAQNSLLTVTDANLSRILYSGSKNDLRKLLDEHLILPTRIFLSEPFKDKSLLQATLMLQPSLPTGKEERYEIARLLLNRGADVRDLEEFLIPAVKAADEKLIQLLVDYGVKDKDGNAYALATELEQSASMPAVKKQSLARTKQQLSNRKSLFTPIMRKSLKASAVPEPVLNQKEKPLPPLPPKNQQRTSLPIIYINNDRAESIEPIENVCGIKD